MIVISLTLLVNEKTFQYENAAVVLASKSNVSVSTNVETLPLNIKIFRIIL